MFHCKRTDPASERGGFTLIEMVLVILLCSGFLGTIYETVIVGLRAVHSADEREAIRQPLASAMDRFVREAAMAETVFQATAQVYQFRADINHDGAFQASETITYQLVGSEFQRVTSLGTVALVRNATALTFDYRDNNDADMTPPIAAGLLASIRVAQITLSATNHNETLSLASAVYTRN